MMKSMKLRSAGCPRGEADRISALSDDLLILILVHLGCATAAARAGLLSRRWRGLWTRLPELVFRDVGLPSLEQALACVISSASSDAVSLLDIRLPKQAFAAGTGESVSSLLRTAARLSPEQLVLALPLGVAPRYSSVELPWFTRATSISLSTALPIVLDLPSEDAGEFPALTTLVLTGCTTDGLAALLLRCPRLHVLRCSSCISYGPDITVHSASVRELVLDEINETRGIDISTPTLEQLTVSATRPRADLRISVLAPKVQKVSWRTHYSSGSFGSGQWTLDAMHLLSTSATSGVASSVMLRVDVAKNRFVFYEDPFVDKDYIGREVQKHLQVATDSSVLDLELRLAPLGHVYRAIVFFFLDLHPIRTAIRSLKVTLPAQPETTRMGKRECEGYCGCAPIHRTTQAIFLEGLEEVGIDGFQEADHEFKFLEHIFTCAPMLKRVALKPSGEVVPTGAKIHAFFKAHPCVEFYYDSSVNSEQA